MNKIIEYGKYPSTWKGLVTLLSLVGVAVSPQLQEYIATAGIAIFGIIETFFSDADVEQ